MYFCSNNWDKSQRNTGRIDIGENSKKLGENTTVTEASDFNIPGFLHSLRLLLQPELAAAARTTCSSYIGALNISFDTK